MKHSLNHIYISFLASSLICIAFGNTARSDGQLSSEWDSREFAEVRLISGTSGIGNGTDIKLGLEFSLKVHEHLWKMYFLELVPVI